MPVKQENIQILIDHLKTMQIGFVAINGYENKLGEISTRRINIGFSYEKAKKADLETLLAGVEFIPSDKYSQNDWLQALAELRRGLEAPNEVRSQAQNDAYLYLTDNGALKYCYETKQIYVTGLELKGSKKIEEGTKSEKVVNSKPVTIAKNVIRSKYLKTGLIRTFTVYRLSEVKLMGDTIEIKDYD